MIDLQLIVVASFRKKFPKLWLTKQNCHVTSFPPCSVGGPDPLEWSIGGAVVTNRRVTWYTYAMQFDLRLDCTFFSRRRCINLWQTCEPLRAGLGVSSCAQILRKSCFDWSGFVLWTRPLIIGRISWVYFSIRISVWWLTSRSTQLSDHYKNFKVKKTCNLPLCENLIESNDIHDASMETNWKCYMIRCSHTCCAAASPGKSCPRATIQKSSQPSTDLCPTLVRRSWSSSMLPYNSEKVRSTLPCLFSQTALSGHDRDRFKPFNKPWG